MNQSPVLSHRPNSRCLSDDKGTLLIMGFARKEARRLLRDLRGEGNESGGGRSDGRGSAECINGMIALGEGGLCGKEER